MDTTDDTATAAPPLTTAIKKEGDLPLLARLYVGGVITAGALVFTYCATHVQVSQWALFLSLIVLSCLASTLKVRLPLTRSASTMSVSYVVDFTALLLLGPEQTVFVAAASAVTQSTLNVRKGNPTYRTLFNIAAIVLTIEFAGLVFGWSGGGAGDLGWPQIATPLLAAATAYYLANTASVSIAVALTSGQRLLRVWNDNFLWCAPSYFVGATVAMVGATIVNGSSQWLLPILIPPVYLTFRSYKVYLGRLEDEQRHTLQVTELHDQAQQALKFAQQSEGRLRETLQLLKSSEERYALAAAGSNDGLWDWDVVRNRVYFSPRWKAMLGLGDDEVGTTLLDWLNRVHPDEVEGLRAALGAHLAGETPHLEHEHRIQTAEGAYRWMLCRGIAVRDADGTATRVAGSQTDVTDRHEAQARLEHAARHDSLTNLPNRAAFMQELGRILGRSKRMGDYRYSVLFVDVDRFKLVNDSLGHLVGDQLLTSVAHKLATCLRTGDVLARLGGDEFTILLDGVNGVGDVEFVAERVQSLFREPMRLDSGREIFVTTSIGIAMGAAYYEYPEELLRDADTAMYRAKALGKACHVVFEQRMRDHAVVRLNLETELRRAIENDELKLVYQPVIALKNGSLAGFEALLRWERAGGEMIPPSEFIPLAEETGVIVPLGIWVLGEACRQAAVWQRQYKFDPPLTMSVNISPRQLMQPGIVEAVGQMLRKHSLAHGTLALEITESALAEDAATAMRVIKELKMLPVQLLLDDFGTGYSSLGHLHRFPVDTVKIDRSFLAKDPLDPSGSNVLAAVVSLAQNLGKGVIVEGIETAEQVERLRKLHCPHAQGFYFSKPVNAVDAGALIALASATAHAGHRPPALDAEPHSIIAPRVH
jgi:diguanylate cyclase (GGDEF)-like protein/PAS domain S-box-containing protein